MFGSFIVVYTFWFAFVVGVVRGLSFGFEARYVAYIVSNLSFFFFFKYFWFCVSIAVLDLLKLYIQIIFMLYELIDKRSGVILIRCPGDLIYCLSLKLRHDVNTYHVSDVVLSNAVSSGDSNSHSQKFHLTCGEFFSAGML